jgi:hypothetical protein
LVQPGDFIEVYCNAALHVCESRDPKGLYKKQEEGRSLSLPVSHRPTRLRSNLRWKFSRDRKVWMSA